MSDLLKEAWAEMTAEGQMFAMERKNIMERDVLIYKNAPPSLREAWQLAAGHGDKDYLVYEDERWTYNEVQKETASIANWLFAQGVEPGDRVAIAMRNFPEWMKAYWACVSVGITVVGMNAWWVPSEMQYAIDDAAPKILIADKERIAHFTELRTAFPAIKVVQVRMDNAPEWTTPWSDLLAQGGEMPEVSVDPDADACIFYTSGTTGFPKGAQLTHRGCVHNIMNMMFWNEVQKLVVAKKDPEAAAAAVEKAATAPQPAGLITTPLFHVTANNCGAHSMTLAGGKIVTMRKWDAGEALKIVEQEKISTLGGVPVMVRELLGHPDRDKYDLSSLSALSAGGAQFQPDLVNRVDSEVKSARPSTGYGMTELCGIITLNAADFFVAKPASCGPAMPTFDVRVVDENGNDVPQGQTGEIWARGPQVIKGYINRPEATAESITDGGWLHTGDIGYVDDDGFIFLVDRAKDMVLRGGENVYCAEVETAIFHHHAVAETTVFGVPDDRLGEEVGAAIVIKEGETLNAEEIRAFCKERLAGYKIPRYIWILDKPLPRNASGKFLKREVKESLLLEDAA